MAGSYKHIVGLHGDFTMCYIENMGDAHEALEDCFGIIQENSKRQRLLKDETVKRGEELNTLRRMNIDQATALQTANNECSRLLDGIDTYKRMVERQANEIVTLRQQVHDLNTQIENMKYDEKERDE